MKKFNPEALTEIILLEEDSEGGLLKSLIEDYGRNFEEIAAKMKTAYDTKDYSQLEMQSHSLKSSSRLLGLEILGELCAQVEEAARNKSADGEKQDLIRAEFSAAYPELVNFKVPAA